MQDSKRGSRTTIDRDARRANRVPVGAGDKLALAGQDPNYFYRWVNDTPGRLKRYLDASYEFCTEVVRESDKGIAEGGTADTRVTANAGQGLTSYAMRIPLWLYNEDQEAKLEKIRKTEDQMRNKNPDPKRGVYGGLSDE
jgi:hypothetical protein